MLTPFALFLAAAVTLAVLKSHPQEAQMARIPVTPEPQFGWHPSVPVTERYESVTVLPYPPAQRATKIVEVFGPRREVLYTEVRS